MDAKKAASVLYQILKSAPMGHPFYGNQYVSHAGDGVYGRRSGPGDWGGGGVYQRGPEEGAKSRNDDKKSMTPKGTATNGRTRMIEGKRQNTADIVNSALDKTYTAEISGNLPKEQAIKSLQYLGHKNPDEKTVTDYAIQQYALTEMQNAVGGNFQNQIGKWNFNNADTIHKSLNGYLDRRIQGQHARWTQATGGR